jgi:hypothetical protein
MSDKGSENTRNKRINPAGPSTATDNSGRKGFSAPNSRSASPHLTENVSGNTRNRKTKTNPTGSSASNNISLSKGFKGFPAPTSRPATPLLSTNTRVSKGFSAPSSRSASPHPSQPRTPAPMGNEEPTNNELLEAIKKGNFEQKVAIDGLREEQRELTNQLRGELTAAVEDFRRKFEIAEQKSNAIKEDVEFMRITNCEQAKQIQDLRKDVNYLQQKDVAHKVLLLGVPRTADPAKIVELLARTIKIDIKPSDILFSSRLGRTDTQPGRPPIILVGFADFNIAEKFVSAQKKFGPLAIDQIEGITRTEGEPLTIRSDYFLTNHFMNLLKEAKATKDKFNYKFVWYKHCAVFLKKEEKAKPIRVLSAGDLASIKN